MAQRDEGGRFLPGQSGNPGGRPKNPSAKLLRDAIDTALTPDQAQRIANRLIEMAGRGDWKAREQLFKVLGVNEPEVFDVNPLPGIVTPEDWASMFDMVSERLAKRDPANTSGQ